MCACVCGSGLYKSVVPNLALVSNPMIQFFAYERVRLAWADWARRRGYPMRSFEFFIMGAIAKARPCVGVSWLLCSHALFGSGGGGEVVRSIHGRTDGWTCSFCGLSRRHPSLVPLYVSAIPAFQSCCVCRRTCTCSVQSCCVCTCSVQHTPLARVSLSWRCTGHCHHFHLSDPGRAVSAAQRPQGAVPWFDRLLAEDLCGRRVRTDPALHPRLAGSLADWLARCSWLTGVWLRAKGNGRTGPGRTV